MRDQRFRLVTLGRLALLAPGGGEDPTLARRRLKLAVLAVLALERRPVARDALVEMFWGEQDEARARHSLSDALSHLRRVLGPRSITTRGAEVELAEDAPLVVDARELDDAVARRDHARAVELYPGPFFDCVYVAASPTFERWTERHRARMEAAFLRACDARCRELERAARWAELGDVAARWLDLAPASSHAAVFRLNALRAPGGRDSALAALAEYERLRARLARELELLPEPAVEALATALRERVAAEDCAATLLAGGAPSADRADAHSAAPVVDAAPDAPSGAPPRAHPPSSRPPRRRTLAAAVAGAALLVAALVGAIWRPHRAAVSPTTVAVLPFSTNGAPEYGYLRTGMVDLLSTNLDGAGVLRAVDPRALLARFAHAGGALGDSTRPASPDAAAELARGSGAGLFVLGDVIAVGGRVRISASLYAAAGRPRERARATTEGPPEQLFALVDGLTRQLLAGYPDPSPDRLTGLAALTTSSLPALKAYLAGVSAYRAANFEAAQTAFEAAAREDSTFALAHYQLSNALLWAARGGWDSVAHTARRASLHATRLTPRARTLVDAYTAFRSGDLDRAERLYRAVLAAWPDEVEAWYQLGDVLYHGNAHRGRSFAEARPAFARVLEIEPEHLGALLHLLRIELWAGRRASAAALIRRADALATPALRAELRALAAFGTPDTSARRAALAGLAKAPDEVVRVTAMRVALFTGDLDGAERIARLLLDRARAPEFRAVGRLQLADLALARGRRRVARAQLDSAALAASGVVPAIALEYRALHLVQPFAGASRGELAAMRDTLDRWDATRVPTTDFPMWAVYDGLHPTIRRYLLGLLSVRLGDLPAAEREARALRELPVEDAGDARAFAAGLSAALQAHVQVARGAPDSAIATFDRGRLVVSEGLLDAPFANQATDRYARAEALRALGRDHEARDWYASLGETTIDLAVFFAPSALRRAQLADRRGSAAEARALYARCLELWRGADAELQPTVAAVRRRLGALGGDTAAPVADR